MAIMLRLPLPFMSDAEHSAIGIQAYRWAGVLVETSTAHYASLRVGMQVYSGLSAEQDHIFSRELDTPTSLLQFGMVDASQVPLAAHLCPLPEGHSVPRRGVGHDCKRRPGWTTSTLCSTPSIDL